MTYLDGELPSGQGEEIAGHLRGCWRCRTRAADIESAIGHISRTFAEADLACLGSDTHLSGSLDGLLASAEPAPIVRGSRPRGRGLLLLATGALAVAAYTTFVAVRPRNPLPGPPVAPVRTTPKPVTLPPETAIVRPLPPPPAVVPPAPPPLVMPPADPEELEIEVRYVLHRLDADVMDSSLTVAQENGRVIVRGVVGSVDRRLHLESALSEVSWPEGVRTELQVPAEIPPVPSAPSSPAMLPAPRTVAPFAAEVRSRAGGAPQAVEVGNQAVALVERVMDLGWALRRLDERYDPGRRSRIPPRGRWLVEAMEIDYLEEIRNVNARLASRLALLLPESTAPLDNESTPSSRPLQESIAALRDLAEWLFAARDMAPAPPTLAAAGADLRNEMEALDKAVEHRLEDVRARQ